LVFISIALCISPSEQVLLFHSISFKVDLHSNMFKLYSRLIKKNLDLSNAYVDGILMLQFTVKHLSEISLLGRFLKSPKIMVLLFVQLHI